MNILFVCSQNRLRSPTAENVFSNYPGYSVRSAGLDKSAIVSISTEDIEWSEIIFVMEQEHKNKLMKRFGKICSNKKIVVLGIPDEYEYMDPTLINELKDKTSKYIIGK